MDGADHIGSVLTAKKRKVRAMNKERKALFDMAQEIKDAISEHKEQSTEDYKVYSVMCQVQKLLTPIPAEIEGGGKTWFTVCGECHGEIDNNAMFCKHCGCAIDWTA